MPHFDPAADSFVSFDGARLGLTVWEGESETPPEHVIVGVHGMNDWAGAFQFVAPVWAEEGVTTYAYDQRGFGRSPNKGIWPKEDLLRKDLQTAVALARKRHPDAQLTVIGISMGAAVAMSPADPVWTWPSRVGCDAFDLSPEPVALGAHSPELGRRAAKGCSDRTDRQYRAPS